MSLQRRSFLRGLLGAACSAVVRFSPLAVVERLTADSGLTVPPTSLRELYMERWKELRAGRETWKLVWERIYREGLSIIPENPL